MENGTRFAPAEFATPGRDPLEQLAERIESLVDADGWDQPFRLFFIRSENIGGLLAYGVVEFPLPDGIGHAHPAEVLPMMGTAFTTVGRAVDGFAGLAVVTEAWMVTTAEPDSPEMLAMRARRELHLHPDRQECRQVSLFALPARAVMVNRVRGEKPVVAEGVITGAIPDAVRTLALTVGSQS